MRYGRDKLKAIRFHTYGSADVLRYETVPDPPLADGEVLVRVRACAVNHVDIDIRAGISRLPVTLPHILGLEMAGEVVEAPIESGHPPGSRVVITKQTCGRCESCLAGHQELCPNILAPGIHRSGGYAEFIRVPSRTLIPIDQSLSFEEATCVQTTYGTVWHSLIVRAGIRPGETVLISAAGSGVGSAAIDVARWAGARVIATAGSPEKLDKALAHGADEVINYRSEDTVQRVRQLTGGRGADAALESVGGKVFVEALASLRPGGRIAVVGGHGGESVALDLIVLFRDQISIIGCQGATEHELRHVVQLANQGVFHPVIHAVLPLAEASRAHRLVEAREHYGKVVLRPA